MTDYLERLIDWRKPEIADSYDELPLWSSYFGHLLLNDIPLGHNQKVLDIGFGTGFPLIEIAQRLGNTSTVYGIDQWESASNRARRKIETFGIENVKLFNGSASNMPFENDFFDFVTANLVLNNLEEQEKSLGEVYRVIKKGGSFHMTSNLVGHMKEFYDVFSTTLSELGMNECREALAKNIEHRLTVEIISSKLLSAGFKNLKTQTAEFYMRFTDGSALLNHSFIILGFIDGWKSVIPEKDRPYFFEKLEENLNNYSKEKGELKLTIPMVYIKAGKT